MAARFFLLADDDAVNAPQPDEELVTQLSEARALMLQKELVMAYSAPGLHRKLARLQEQQAAPEEHRLAFKSLVRRAQAAVLPMYSFAATDEGVALLSVILGQFPDSPYTDILATMIRNAQAGFVRNALEVLEAEGEEAAAEALDEADEVRSVRAESLEGFPRLGHADAELLLELLQQAFGSRRYQRLAMVMVDAEHFPLPLPRNTPMEFCAWLPKDILHLTLMVYAEVLPRFGFAPGKEGVSQMWLSLLRFLNDDAMMEKATGIIHSMFPSTKLLWERPREYPRAVQDDTFCPAFTQESAIAMQLELLTLCSTPKFQIQLNVVHRTYHPRSADFGQRLAFLLDSVYSQVLPRYGFECTGEGLEILVLAMGKALRTPAVHALATALDGLLYGVELDAREEATEDGVSKEQRLGKRRALQLLRDQLAACSDPAFQLQVAALKGRALRAEDPLEEGPGFPAGCAQLAMTVQQDILPRYGLEASPLGVHAMFQQCAQYILDPEVARLTSGINFLLGMKEAACKAFVARLIRIQNEVVLPSVYLR